jgi:uncharacterized protein YbaR (Trm112 family)
MKLITHNILICNRKGCTKNYPLFIKANKINFENSVFDNELITKLIKKIDFNVLNEASKQLNVFKADISMLSEEEKNQNDIKSYFHFLLNEVSVEDGFLVCEGCGREYEIKDGIPNMVLGDDEV